MQLYMENAYTPLARKTPLVGPVGPLSRGRELCHERGQLSLERVDRASVTRILLLRMHERLLHRRTPVRVARKRCRLGSLERRRALERLPVRATERVQLSVGLDQCLEKEARSHLLRGEPRERHLPAARLERCDGLGGLRAPRRFRLFPSRGRRRILCASGVGLRIVTLGPRSRHFVFDATKELVELVELRVLSGEQRAALRHLLVEVEVAADETREALGKRRVACLQVENLVTERVRIREAAQK